MATIQRQRDEMFEIRERLVGWADWLRATKICSLGFAGKANFVSALPGVTEYDDENAEETERVMLCLKRKYPAMYDVLIQEYFFRMTNVDGARILGISVATYKNRRLMGEHFIAGALEQV